MPWKTRLRDILIKPEPPVPPAILGEHAARFTGLPAGASLCIKISSAHDLPYPFAASVGFLTRLVEEIRAVQPTVKITLTEGGVGGQAIQGVAAKQGLSAIPHTCFVDAESVEPVWVANPNPTPHQADGFWLPSHWVEADARLLVTTCKLRSHHFQRWFSGGTRNLIGLLPRERYKLASSRRDMRSVMHQQGMDRMVADLYATTGQDVFTVLDVRLLARQDEHFPLRFTRPIDRVLIADDPACADRLIVDALHLPFTPPYLTLIEGEGKILDKRY